MAYISITPENRIRFICEDVQKEIDLNQMYQGYYPACRFTDAAVCAGMLYVSGTDTAGLPHVYTSHRGDVWTEIPISPQKSLINERIYGDILRILFDPESAQLFLVTRNGCLVTLPDCPKCVRARHVSDQPLADGKIDGKKIVMTTINGDTIPYSIYVAAEYRCAWSYAQNHVGKDSVVIDLQTAPAEKMPGAVQIALEDMDLLLAHLPKETYVFFVCEHGRKADEAVRDARSMGLRNSYSLGSVGDVRRQIQEETTEKT